MPRRTLRRLLRLRSEGRRAAFAVVVSAKGSVPARPGAFMLVEEDGAIAGTVGGAELEWRSRVLALAALKGGARRESFDLWTHKEGGIDLECGGTVEVWAGAPDASAATRKEIGRRLDAREPFALRLWPSLEVLAPGAAGEPVVAIEPPPYALLCGGGHVNYELSKIAHQLDWDVAVVDERPEYRARERFPEARDLAAELPASLGAFTHIVIAGHRPGFELDCLDRIVREFGGYIGLIGSKAKKKSFYATLEKRGVSAEALARVEMPIGVPIGAVTPGEIAVSVAASIVRTWRGGR